MRFHQGNRLGGAVRCGDFKLIENFDDGSTELYNLATDISEQTDLSNSMPSKVAEMREMLQDWRTTTEAAMPTRSR